jgi:hypothetical protein
MGLTKSCFDAIDVCRVQQCGSSSAVATIRVTAEIVTQPPTSLVKELGGIFDAVSGVRCWVVVNCLSHSYVRGLHSCLSNGIASKKGANESIK